MTKSYYKLLHIERDLPQWMLRPKLEDAIRGIQRAYGEAIPPAFGVAIATLSNDDEREFYDSILEWADAGQPKEFSNADEIAARAERHHFAVERLSPRKLLFENLDFEVPLPHEMEKQGSPGHPPGGGHSAETTSQPQVDAWGRVNGQEPYLVLGTRTFAYRMVDLRLQHAALHTIKCGFRKKNYVRTMTWTDGETPYSFRDYISAHYEDSVYRPGKTYGTLWLRDLETRENFFCAYGYVDGGNVVFMQANTGLWQCFYWKAKALEFAEAFQGYNIRENYFGTGFHDSPASVGLAVKYLTETGYWLTAYLTRDDASPDVCRQVAKGSLRLAIHPWQYSRRVLARYGIPPFP